MAHHGKDTHTMTGETICIAATPRVGRLTGAQPSLPGIHPPTPTQVRCPTCRGAGVIEPAGLPDVTPPTRHTDPDTSHDAAGSVDTFNARQTHIAILTLLGQPQPDHMRIDAALWERFNRMRAAYGWPMQSPSGLRTRRSELVRAGHVVDTGRRQRKDDTGRRAAVWAITPSGRQLLASMEDAN